MKKSEIKHISEPDHDPELVLTQFLSDDGQLVENAAAQPEDWDNVIQLCGSMFYVYDDSNPRGGRVYIGEFV